MVPPVAAGFALNPGGLPSGLVDTFLNADVMWRALPMLMRGLVNTFYLAVTSIALGTLAGIFVCIARLYGPKPVRLLAVGFIDIFRALPILVVLIVIYYALPFVRIRLDSFTSATLALSIVLAAFTAEVFRAGIKSIPDGQFEAANALGLPFWVTLIKVVIPQAVRIATPPQTSNCIAIAKDTSLASVVAMPDLLKQATDAQALMANPSPLIAAAAIYLIILWPLVRLVAYLEPAAPERSARGPGPAVARLANSLAPLGRGQGEGQRRRWRSPHPAASRVLWGGRNERPLARLQAIRFKLEVSFACDRIVRTMPSGRGTGGWKCRNQRDLPSPRLPLS